MELSQDFAAAENSVAAVRVSGAARRLAFSRPYSEARPFEQEALAAINVTLEERGDPLLPRNDEPLHLSSVFLGSGKDVADLTIFFRSASIGGSGSTLYYFVALPIPQVLGGYRLDIEFETSEGGNVLIFYSSFIQDTISVTDPPSTLSLEFIPTIKYINNPTE